MKKKLIFTVTNISKRFLTILSVKTVYFAPNYHVSSAKIKSGIYKLARGSEDFAKNLF